MSRSRLQRGSLSAELSRRETDPAVAPAPRGSARDLRAALIHVAAALTILVISVFILKSLQVILQPLLIAVFLYYLASPVVDFLSRRGVATGWAHFLVLGLSAAAVVLFATLLVEKIDDFGRQLPKFQSRLQELGASAAGDMSSDLPFLRRHALKGLERVDILSPLAGGVNAFLVGLPAFVAGTLLTAFFLIFLIQEQRALPRRLRSIFGEAKAARVEAISDRINTSIARYMYVKFLASLFTAVVALVVMLLFKLNLAVLWAAVLFLLNFVPYVGSVVGFAFPMAMAVLQFSDPKTILILGAIFFALDAFVGNYWEPRMAGARLNLSPVVVVFAVAFWGWLWGAVGMILSVPITVSLRFVLENIPFTRPLALLISSHPAPERRAS